MAEDVDTGGRPPMDMSARYGLAAAAATKDCWAATSDDGVGESDE